MHGDLQNVGNMPLTSNWNDEEKTGTFPLTWTLYKLVLIIKLYYFTNRVSPVSPFCLYVQYMYVCMVYARRVAATVFELLSG